ncbi:hypothetical protein MPH_05492 [Macrophomina phaseolina MS6]|uniref:Uncharacterized protein n=1 Tax=Macrophomina phaseolina (strain MS6) TaxID=1126212 RepID=K2RX25_MACPH|nr:hypothetical protein MPH_05492 [Macrophomina phaseolina MS6]
MYARGNQSPFFPPASASGSGSQGANVNVTPFINTFNGMSVGPNGSFSSSTAQQRKGGMNPQSSFSSHGQVPQHGGHDQDVSAESLPQWQDIDVNLPIAGDLVVRTEAAEFTWHGKVPGRLKVVFMPDGDAAAAAALATGAGNGAVGGGGGGGAGKPSPSSWRSVNNSD